jgi:hypothetical protein
MGCSPIIAAFQIFQNQLRICGAGNKLKNKNATEGKQTVSASYFNPH